MNTLAERATALCPRRILIVRLSALGDVVLSSGLIPALKQRWPEAQLSWLVASPAAPLLTHNAQLDELLVLPLDRWKQLWRTGQRWQAWHEFRAWQRDLRARRFDLVVDPQGLFKSGVLAWLTRAPLRVSLWPREGNQLFMHGCVRPAIPAAADRIISFEYRALAEALGAPGFALDLAVGEGPRQRAAQVFAQADVGPGPIALLAPFTTRPQKHWVEARWAPLAQALRAQGLQPVLLGGPGDVPAAERIAPAGSGIVNLAGRLKLDETVAAVARGQLLIGVDTGLTHMGIALGVPTVGLFGSTAPYLQGGTPQVQILYKGLPCSPCHRNPSCQGRFDCMRQLTLPEVLQAAQTVRQAATP
ncbi:glycosyltransferase family 9 protein [Ideonella sp. B7]|uniref:glycosyltransferase family 9 protein n=1 Tax=Ideonella benzenivorans TaxID=2831643 RepID=UPI001CED40F0|nr:glycosyltransferase family 9 protein [Ideonella benzenivorans]MCA6217803.1 glycosyltransferase family 9 protein [Ideonella benzenivorans]